MKQKITILSFFFAASFFVAGCLGKSKAEKYLCPLNMKNYLTITNPEGTFEPDSYGGEGGVKEIRKPNENSDTVSKTIVDLRMISSANDKAYILYIEMDTMVTTGAYAFDRVDSAYVFIKDIGPLKVSELNINFTQLAQIGGSTHPDVSFYGYSTGTFEGKYVEGSNEVSFSGSFCSDQFPEDE